MSKGMQQDARNANSGDIADFEKTVAPLSQLRLRTQ